MRQIISEVLSTAVDWAWGLPLLFLLLGGGLYLLWVSRFLPLMGFSRAVLLVTGRYHHKDEQKADGQITHFQALSNALAATVGLGNIGGVAVAIHQGGPGAIFWMWVAAVLGMNTKFFECTLAVMFRSKDYRGEVQGGPMYVIKEALGPRFRPLALLFALFGLVGTLPLFQVNQLAVFVHDQYQLDPLILGLGCALLVGYTIRGGIRRLAQVTSSLVPVMCVLYVLVSLTIIALNWSKVPDVFLRILTEAFSGRAAVGGALGIGVIQVLKIGVKRASFSNEAGIGTAPMAHSNAKTSEPIAEGFVAMLGPFLDTIVVCTMTAVVILTALPDNMLQQDNGVLLTLQAFEHSLPGLGSYFVGVAVILFSMTTMIGYSNYAEKCWNFLFKGRRGFGEHTFTALFSLALVLGALGSVDEIVNLLDTSFALMAFPNMLATVILAPKVKEALSDYLARYRL